MTIPAIACSGTYYSFESGSRTADGNRFNPYKISIALRNTHYGDYYKVCYNGRCIRALHNDWGPAAWTGNCIDLSLGAKNSLHFPGKGNITYGKIK